jgi:hypothetical protein
MFLLLVVEVQQVGICGVQIHEIIMLYVAMTVKADRERLSLRVIVVIIYMMQFNPVSAKFPAHATMATETGQDTVGSSLREFLHRHSDFSEAYATLWDSSRVGSMS